MAYIARTDGTREPIDTPVSLEQAQEIIGGYVEPVRSKYTPSIIFLCDEDGHLKQLPYNDHGCELHAGPIVGDIIVFEKRSEAQGWF